MLKFATNFKHWLKEWRRKMTYNDTQRVRHLHLTILTDQVCMAHDPVAYALTERHLSLLRDHWESVELEDVGAFRDRIGLRPKRHY